MNKNGILRFDPDKDEVKISRENLLGTMFDIIFTGGPPKGDEGPLEPEVEELLSQPNITYDYYIKNAGFSNDSMAYNTPWYNYDKRWPVSRSYREFIWEVKSKYGIKIAYIFFTNKFTKIIKPTSKNLKAIEEVFFNQNYLQWT